MQCKCDFLYNKRLFLVKIWYKYCQFIEKMDFVIKKIID